MTIVQVDSKRIHRSMWTAIVIFCMAGAAFADPTIEPLATTINLKDVSINKLLKSDQTDPPQPVKPVNKIPIYGPQAINEFNYDYVKVPFYPFMEPYNKNYYNFYPNSATPFGFPEYYPYYYPTRSYTTKYVGQYSPKYPVHDSKYVYYEPHHQQPYLFKQVYQQTPFIGLGEKSGVTVPVASTI